VGRHDEAMPMCNGCHREGMEICIRHDSVMPLRVDFTARGRKMGPPRVGDAAATGKSPLGDDKEDRRVGRYRSDSDVAARRREWDRHDSVMPLRVDFAARGRKMGSPRSGDAAATGKSPRGDENEDRHV
jgi:hypothetical protein